MHLEQCLSHRDGFLNRAQGGGDGNAWVYTILNIQVFPNSGSCRQKCAVNDGTQVTARFARHRHAGLPWRAGLPSSWPECQPVNTATGTASLGSAGAACWFP